MAGNVDPSHATQTWTIDTNRPTVTSVSPGSPDGVSGVLVTTQVVAVFSEPMDKPATEAAFSLKRTSDGAPVTGNFCVW